MYIQTFVNNLNIYKYFNNSKRWHKIIGEWSNIVLGLPRFNIPDPTKLNNYRSKIKNIENNLHKI